MSRSQDRQDRLIDELSTDVRHIKAELKSLQDAISFLFTGGRDGVDAIKTIKSI